MHGRRASGLARAPHRFSTPAVRFRSDRDQIGEVDAWRRPALCCESRSLQLTCEIFDETIAASRVRLLVAGANESAPQDRIRVLRKLFRVALNKTFDVADNCVPVPQWDNSHRPGLNRLLPEARHHAPA